MAINPKSLENLKPIKTTEEARERGRKGGLASAEAKKERKRMQEEAKMILGLALKRGEIETVENLSDVVRVDENGKPIIGQDGKPIAKNLTVQTAALIAQASLAVKGDSQALAFLRDTAGEKPVEEVRLTPDVKDAVDDISSMIEDLKKGDVR